MLESGNKRKHYVKILKQNLLRQLAIPNIFLLIIVKKHMDSFKGRAFEHKNSKKGNARKIACVCLRHNLTSKVQTSHLLLKTTTA